MANAQEYINQNYPQEERSKEIFLDIGFQGLEGSLDLNDFVNLEKLVCSYNFLTSLDISRCEKLAELVCDTDQYTNSYLINESKKEIINKKQKIGEKESILKAKLDDERKKELLDRLIKIRIELNEYKKSNDEESTPNYRKTCQKYEDEIDEIVDKEENWSSEKESNEVLSVLNRYESLNDEELKLKKKFEELVNINFPPQEVKVITIRVDYKYSNPSSHWKKEAIQKFEDSGPDAKKVNLDFKMINWIHQEKEKSKGREELMPTKDVSQEKKEDNQKFILDNLDKYTIDDSWNQFICRDEERTFNDEYAQIPFKNVINVEEIKEKIVEMIIQNKKDWELVEEQYHDFYRKKSNNKLTIYAFSFSAGQNHQINMALGHKKLTALGKEKWFDSFAIMSYKLNPFDFLMVNKNDKLRSQCRKLSEQITSLEKRIKELFDLAKKVKNDAINITLELAKALEGSFKLSELVEVQDKLIDFKKKEIDSSNYDKKCNEYEEELKAKKEQLQTKLTSEEMTKVEEILAGNELIKEWSWERGAKLKEAKELIEKEKQIISQMEANNLDQTTQIQIPPK